MNQYIKEIAKYLLFPFIYLIFKKKKKVVYFTFDDGPNYGTKKCFEICTDQNIPATFFMVGTHLSNKHREEIKDLIHKEYPFFLIANHSYSHGYENYFEFYQNPKKALKDFLLAQDTLGLVKKIVRLPGNNSWICRSKIKTSKITKPICDLLSSHGYNIYGWDIEYNIYKDSKALIIKSPNQLLKDVYWHLFSFKFFKEKKVVVLLHDRLFEQEENCRHLNSFIFLLKKQGFIFETIDQY